MSGAERNASAMLVSGPVGTSHTPSLLRTVSMMNADRVAARRAAPTAAAARRRRARSRRGRIRRARGGAISGRLAPACTGTSMPRRSRRTIALLRRRLQRCIAGDRGDAEEVGVAGSDDHRDRVVVARVAVEDDGKVVRGGAMTVRACHRYDRRGGSRRCWWLALVALRSRPVRQPAPAPIRPARRRHQLRPRQPRSRLRCREPSPSRRRRSQRASPASMPRIRSARRGRHTPARCRRSASPLVRRVAQRPVRRGRAGGHAATRGGCRCDRCRMAGGARRRAANGRHRQEDRAVRTPGAARGVDVLTRCRRLRLPSSSR